MTTPFIVVLPLFEILRVASLSNPADRATLAIDRQGHAANATILEEQARGVKRSSLVRSEDARSSRHAQSEVSGGYDRTVLSDKPVVYYRLNEVNNTPKAVNYGTIGVRGDAQILRSHHFKKEPTPYFEETSLTPNDGNKAMKFDGGMDKIMLPNLTEINNGTDGYLQRTIELWFLSERYEDHFHKYLYEEGDQYTGLSMYVHQDHYGHGWLTMFAWNTPGFMIMDKEKGPYFGVTGTGDQPITCMIDLGITYYVAFVFDASAGSYRGYVRNEEQHSIQDCGTPVTLPSGSRLMWHPDVGCFGNICDHSRSGAGSEHVDDGSVSAHFKGWIDEVAIYNTALSKEKLTSHATSGYG